MHGDSTAHLRFRWAGATDAGTRRERNEDALYPEGTGEVVGRIVLAVADGMGGEPAGDVASRIAVESVAAHANGARSAAHLVDRAATDLAEYASRHGEDRPDLWKMATTLTVAVIDDLGRLDVAHVGDSRLYAHDHQGLLQVTRDHTVAMDLVRAGELDLEDARHHPMWHTMSNWLGARMGRTETASLQLLAGDRVLLCTDGLTNVLTDEEIAGHLGQADEQDCVRHLIEAANRAGGPDNITVLVATLATG